MATSFEYSRQAQTYDTTRAASPSVLGPIRAALAGASVGRLLDVGGGTGNYSRALAVDGWEPLVVDRNVAMLRVAATKGIAICQGDAAALPVPDASFDAVALISMLHHVPDWPDALDEAQRAVAPGGVVAAMVFTSEQLGTMGVDRYFPRTLAHFVAGHATADELRAAMPGATEHLVHYTDLVDGSLAALARHPELLLDEDRRRQTSFVEWASDHEHEELASGTAQLAADLAAGLRPQDTHAEERAEIGDATVFAWTRPRADTAAGYDGPRPAGTRRVGARATDRSGQSTVKPAVATSAGRLPHRPVAVHDLHRRWFLGSAAIARG